MNFLRKAERWFKRLVTKARTLFEQLEDEWERLDPQTRQTALMLLVNLGYLKPFPTEADLWREARKWRDDRMEYVLTKVRDL